jgi:hypothetical protein
MNLENALAKDWILPKNFVDLPNAPKDSKELFRNSPFRVRCFARYVTDPRVALLMSINRLSRRDRKDRCTLEPEKFAGCPVGLAAALDRAFRQANRHVDRDNRSGCQFGDQGSDTRKDLDIRFVEGFGGRGYGDPTGLAGVDPRNFYRRAKKQRTSAFWRRTVHPEDFIDPPVGGTDGRGLFESLAAIAKAA